MTETCGNRDDQFWAEFFGIEPSDWSVPGISVRPHVGLSGYCGLWCFRHGDRTVVSAPRGWLGPLTSRLDGSQPDRLFDERFLRQLLGKDFSALIGPAFQGCLDPRRFRPVFTANVRWIESNDEAAIARFRDRCGFGAWEQSGLDKATRDRAAHFLGLTITAMAGYRSWSDVAGDPCVLTHPEFYGKGHGTAVVSAVVDKALQEGKLLLYQTVEANRGAVRIALKLGYEQYARHVAVRLKRDTPSDVHE